MSDAFSQEKDSVEDAVAEVVDAFRERTRRGECPDVEEYAHRHPQLADILRRVLPALEVLRPHEDESLSSGMAAVENMPAVLGDFRIFHEVGKGGMGVVYEAEQISLRRRVALKVLPFAATMDPRHLQRFHNEAQAAACLHHTNIVPVFFVGSERGIHFYAMQFIDGQPLSSLIRQLRGLEKNDSRATVQQPTAAYQVPPGGAIVAGPTVGVGSVSTPLTGEGRRGRDYYRKVAELGVQAAEALDHAHQLGIVHRDIKPANLLMDVRGHVWVTDFGLAHIQHGEVSLTLTGQAVGTPRYMSPEQALAKRVPIDHRTDVYSLGVTLYELLTLRPAFASEDRQELLRQIAFEEPLRPRRMERAIPAELEIIVLKAMEKRPQERYTTAQELADDLERWLKHEPIRARRPSLLQRASKWVRRHPRTATILAMVALIAVAAWVTWDRQRLQAEAASRQVAEQAEVLWRKGRLPEAETVARRAADLLPRVGGDTGLKQRVGEMVADYTLLRRLDEARLHRFNHNPRATEIDRQPTLAGFEAAFREEYGIDVLSGDEASIVAGLSRRAIRADLVAALDDWSVETKNPAESLRLMKLADALDPDPQGIAARWRRLSVPGNVEEFRKLAAEAERNPPPTAFLVRLGLCLIESSDREAGLRLLRLAWRRRPNDIFALGALSQHLLNAGDDHAAEAARYFTAALSLFPSDPIALVNLGFTLSLVGRDEEALDYYRAAQAIEPNHALIHRNIGASLAILGRLEEALGEFHQAVALDPDDSEAWHNLGRALVGLKRLAEAVEALRKAISMKKNVETYNALSDALCQLGQFDQAKATSSEAVKLAPQNAEAHARLGLALLSLNRFAEAVESYRRAHGLTPHYSYAYNQGNALAQLGKMPEAEAAYREAIRLRPDYAMALCNLGRTLEEQGRFAEALPLLRRGHELGSKNPGWPYSSDQWVKRCERLVEVDNKLPAILNGEQQPADIAERLTFAHLCAKRYKKHYLDAVRLFREAFEEQTKQAEDLNFQYRYDAACAAALAGCGQGKDADKLDTKERALLRQQALDWLRADLKAYRQLLEKSAGKSGPFIASRMQHWLQDTDFACVRGDESLARLPEAERKDWHKLWEEVEALRQRATKQPQTASSARP